MSLLVDPDYAIYALRLAYLRKIDDHAGPRVITFPSVLNLPQRDHETAGRKVPKSSAQSTLQDNDVAGQTVENSVLFPLPANSHVVIAGLNDARYQPELSTLHSPKIDSLFSPFEDPHVDLFGSSSRNGKEAGSTSLAQGDRITDGTGKRKGSGGLKYTSTILGPGRTGALGMRVNGRRAMSGDASRRARGSSRDGIIDTVPEQANDVEDAPSRQSFEGSRRPDLPTVQFDTSAQQESITGTLKSHRSASFRMPDKKAEHNLALASFRNRSSSQPYHPAMSSGLRSVGSVSEEEDTSAEYVSTPAEEIKDQGTPKTNLPPSRPPRSSHRSEPHRNQESFQISVMPSAQASSFSPLRRRSASEGADFFMRRPKADALSEEIRGEVEGEKAEEETESLREGGIDARPSVIKSMSRLNSDATILSLASPLNKAKRDLSPRSRPMEYDPQHLSPMSSTTRDTLASYQLTVNPSDTSSPATSRYATISSSPLSRRAVLSGSMDGGSNLGGNSASGSSSVPLDNSSGFNSIGRPPSLLYETTSRQLAGADEALDDSLEGSNLSYTTHAGAPLNSALGLDVAWTEDNRGKSDGTAQLASSKGDDVRQQGRDTSPLIKAEKSVAKQSAAQRRARSDAQQEQQQWFASLKADQETVARRFKSQPQKSGISALLSKHSQGPSNSFAAMYKHVAGGSVSGGSNTTIEVYFPFASQSDKSMSLTVRKDATMEEIIGYSLYCYVEEGWTPQLDESLTEASTQEDREIRMSTLGWTLRIVEDGEVDDDYPAIDRNMLVGKFGADELAVCEATSTQIKQHLAALPKVQRRTIQPQQAGQVQQAQSGAQQPSTEPSKQNAGLPLGPSARLAAAAGNNTAGSLVNFGGTPMFASSALSKSVMAPIITTIFLRVLITPNPEVKYKTTLQVPSDMYLADVLETICRKRQLADVDQWAFVVPEQNIVVPLDRTVESLQGNHDLALVRRQDLGHQAGSGALTGQSTNPNASIFKRMSEPVHHLGGSIGGGSKGITSTYKSYTVNRKQASFLGRHERTLTIDGDWIHIIPTDSKAFQAQTHTTSFPISVIASCYQSRIPSAFKLIVARENDQKRYEFEAENSTVAAEIVDEINSIIKRTK